MKVLVVDNEPDVRSMLRHMLKVNEGTVHESDSGEAALEEWQSLSPDLVITDHLMPGITGIQLAASLREQGLEGPILLFSAHLDTGVMQQARDADIVTISKVDHQSLLRFLRALRAEI